MTEKYGLESFAFNHICTEIYAKICKPFFHFFIFQSSFKWNLHLDQYFWSETRSSLVTSSQGTVRLQAKICWHLPLTLPSYLRLLSRNCQWHNSGVLWEPERHYKCCQQKSCSEHQTNQDLHFKVVRDEPKEICGPPRKQRRVKKCSVLSERLFQHFVIIGILLK